MDIDYYRFYCPKRIPGLLNEALKKMGSPGEKGVLELAARLGISRSYAYRLLSREAINPSYGIQVMLECLLEPDGLQLVDARQHHDPGQAPALIEGAIREWGTQQLVAEKLGVSRDYLLKLSKEQRKRSMSYKVALMLCLMQ